MPFRREIGNVKQWAYLLAESNTANNPIIKLNDIHHAWQIHNLDLAWQFSRVAKEPEVGRNVWRTATGVEFPNSIIAYAYQHLR